MPYATPFFLLVLPWQIRYIAVPSTNQYTIISLYAFDIVLAVLIVLWLIHWYHVKDDINWRFFTLGLGFVVLVFLSAYWAGDRDVALYLWLRFSVGVALIGIVATMPLRLPLVLWSLIFGGIIQTGFAWVQFFMQRVVGHAWLGMASQSPITPGTAVVVTETGRWLRSYGIMPHPNSAGGFIVLALIACCVAWTLTHRMWQRHALLAATILLSSGLLFTFSRSAFLIFGIIIALGFWLCKEQRPVLFTSLVTLIIVGAPLFTLLSARLNQHAYTEQFSFSERSSQYKEAIGFWSRYWPMGMGIGQYTLQSTNKTDPQPVHFVPLLIAIEVGIGATLLWYWLNGEVLWKTTWRKSLAGKGTILHNSSPTQGTAFLFFAILALGLFDHYFWTLPSMFLLWCVILGLHIHLSNVSHFKTT